jgi:hypothetical protein
MSPETTSRGAFPEGTRRPKPTPDEVERLIASAREHPLGIEFLQWGALDAVAATFRTHAFVVDAARERLAKAGPLTDA